MSAIYGAGSNYINLGVGLPISIYKAKKEEFTQKLRGLGTIEDVVNRKEILVNIVDVKVMAEGYASIRPLSQYIDKDNTTLIIDIGMKTTDVILVEWDGKIKISNYGTTNIAFFRNINLVAQNILTIYKYQLIV